MRAGRDPPKLKKTCKKYHRVTSPGQSAGTRKINPQGHARTIARDGSARDLGTLCLFLIFVCGRRRHGSLGRAFAARTANRTPQEGRLLVLLGRSGGRLWCCCRTLPFPLLRCWRSRRCLRWLAGFLPETVEFPIAAVRALIAIAAAEPAFRLAFAAIAIRTPVIAIAVLARPIAVVPVTTEILAIATIVAVIETLIAIVPRLAIFVAVRMIEIARLLRIWLLLSTFRRRLLLRLDAELVALVLPELVAFAPFGTGKSMGPGSAIAERIETALLRHLLAIAEDDAIIMLSVLQIIFCENRIAGRKRVARQRNILLGNMRGRAADFHIRPRTLEAAH